IGTRHLAIRSRRETRSMTPTAYNTILISSPSTGEDKGGGAQLAQNSCTPILSFPRRGGRKFGGRASGTTIALYSVAGKLRPHTKIKERTCPSKSPSSQLFLRANEIAVGDYCARK